MSDKFFYLLETLEDGHGTALSLTTTMNNLEIVSLCPIDFEILQSAQCLCVPAVEDCRTTAIVAT
jgi:hypothetical protein